MNGDGSVPNVSIASVQAIDGSYR
ncbi:unnamed protein product [Fusarium venenatum]|uniref:Uncharacterized protein n=1 Tax=Fusarium venenatum TaxID=56646 RepID=A0A2L2TWC0_9HYPO|nr:unnamed protein product [Fusarium venenatum]